jgi:hypothetical protein
MNNSMMLITSTWGSSKTFKMIPVNKDCPFNECIFDLDAKVLAVIGKDGKDTMHMVAKLNEWGDPVTMKIGKRQNGKDYAEERKTLNTFYEYYIEESSEIAEFVKMFAVNNKSFDVDQYLNAEKKPSNLLAPL